MPSHGLEGGRGRKRKGEEERGGRVEVKRKKEEGGKGGIGKVRGKGRREEK